MASQHNKSVYKRYTLSKQQQKMVGVHFELCVNDALEIYNWYSQIHYETSWMTNQQTKVSPIYLFYFYIDASKCGVDKISHRSTHVKETPRVSRDNVSWIIEGQVISVK